MSPEQIERLVQRLERSTIAECEYEQDGAQLRLQFKHAPTARAVVSIAGASSAPAAGPASVQAAASTFGAVNSSATGIFHGTHPLLKLPFVAHGDTVAKGQLVAFLRVGPVVSSVRAPASGVLGAQLVVDGTLVGYG